MSKHDISKERKKSISESTIGTPREVDPSRFHGMRVPASIKNRMMKAGNKMVIRILDANLPPNNLT